MKRMMVLFGMIFVLLLSSTTGVFADAASYDMQIAGYNVYVATPDGGLNMRYGPGTDYEKVMDERIPDGVCLYIEYTSDTWGLTSYNGNEGWVALKQTSKTPPATPTPKPKTAPSTPASQPTTAAVNDAPATETPTVTDAAKETSVSSAESNVAETKQENSGATSAMMSQLILIAVLLVVVIVLAVVLIVIVNKKSRK